MPDSSLESFLKYIDMIHAASARMNLVSKNDLSNIIDRHLLDSLQALTIYDFPDSVIVADLGSGAGFPGIPIAIARPSIKIDLIESRYRKCLFLKSVIENLDLPNANVIHNRWENNDKSYDIILARASLKESDLRQKALIRLNPGGALLYYSKYNQIKILKK